jgi:hypothetical protein
MPLTLLSQIALGVKRDSLRLRSIDQLVDPSETGVSANSAFASERISIDQNPWCPLKRETLRRSSAA